MAKTNHPRRRAGAKFPLEQPGSVAAQTLWEKVELDKCGHGCGDRIWEEEKFMKMVSEKCCVRYWFIYCYPFGEN